MGGLIFQPGDSERMADNTSLEHKVFTQSFDEIVNALSSNLTDIAGKLVAERLIPSNLYHNIVYPVSGITEKQRAGQLVSHIGDVVKRSPQKFGVFVEILRGDLYYEDVVTHLNDRLQESHGEYIDLTDYLVPGLG